MFVNGIPAKCRIQDHLPWCTEVLLGMGFFSYNPVQSLQGVISVFHNWKIQSPPFSVASPSRYLSTLNTLKINKNGGNFFKYLIINYLRFVLLDRYHLICHGYPRVKTKKTEELNLPKTLTTSQRNAGKKNGKALSSMALFGV